MLQAIKRIRRPYLFLALAIVLLYLLLSNHHKKDVYIPQLNPVNAAPVIEKSVPTDTSLPGVVETYQYVNLKSQIDGTIVKINFAEGEIVEANQVLFEIDSKEFNNQLKQAQANLAKDQAQLKNAEQEEARYNQLLKAKAVSQEQYTQILTNRDALVATVTADQNIIDNVKLQISHCSISTPVSGKTGESPYRVGNLVQAQSAIPLVTVAEIAPILVTFYLPEPLFTKALKDKKDDKIKILIKTTNEETMNDGEIIFIDNTVNPQTNTIKIKAILSNEHEILWPGQSVEVLLSIENDKKHTVIPASALHLNQGGQYVFVIDDNIAQLRNIKISSINGDDAIIDEGLKVGEVVVTSGAFRLTNGSKVIINNSN